MENQHRLIAGYTEFSAEDIGLINEAKALAEQCGAFIEKLRAYVPHAGNGDGSTVKPGATLDQRWISIGATDLQRGFMAVIRGIAQPLTF
jgi:hypothetical protein